MNFIKFFFVFIFFFNNKSFFSQEIGSIEIETVHKNVFNLSPVEQLAIQYNLYDYYQDERFAGVDPLFIDWNSDGLLDIFIGVTGGPDTGVLNCLFIQDQNLVFNPETSYHSYIPADGGRLNGSIGDFDSDGDYDLYYATANYHGSLDPPPDWYDENCPSNTSDRILFNNQNGFDELVLDEHDIGPDGCPINLGDHTVYDIDNDQVDEILIAGYVRDDILNPLFQNQSEGFHIKYYDINNNQEISTGFAISLEETTGVGIPVNSITERENKIFLPIAIKKFRNNSTRNVGIRDTPEFGSNCQNEGDCSLFEEYFILKYPNKESLFTTNFEKIPLIFSENRGYAGEYGSFFISDIDGDSDLEFILGSISHVDGENQPLGKGFEIFESDGTNVTQSWIGNLSINPSKEVENKPIYNGADNWNGINVADLNNDGFDDIIPVDGWYTTDSERRYSKDYKHIVFLNYRGEKFKPYYLIFPEDHYNSANLINLNGAFGGFRYVHDVDSDGLFDLIQIRVFPANSDDNLPDDSGSPNIDIVKLNWDNFDNDDDGVVNSDDQFPNDPNAYSSDSEGNKIFSLPKNNFSISIENLSCRGLSDGSIVVSAVDENLNYTLTINGNDTHNLNSSSGYSKSITNLNTGQYNLCFTVEGESGYNQCFDINITEPAPLSASSRVNNAKKSISFDLSGSNKYTIVHNGIEKDFDHSNPKINLKKGVNFLEVKTDKSCQGSYIEEVFISEEVEFYPNPTKDNVNLYIHGKDNTVDIRVIDGDGNILKTSCNEIHSSRKVQINLEEFSKGIYLIQLSGETVDKTVKIVRE